MDIPKIRWLGHAGFLIESREGTRIVIDPYKVTEKIDADIVLVTHEHFDHFSKEDIERIAKPTALIVMPQLYFEDMTHETLEMKPGDSRQIRGIKIDAVPAYNIAKPFHPRQNNWIGYIIEMDEQRIYHAGDTDLIPEMDEIKADIVMLPIGGTYTMDASQAAEAVKKIRPILAIPMHYGTVVGKSEDADKFQELCECEVRRFDLS